MHESSWPSASFNNVALQLEKRRLCYQKLSKEGGSFGQLFQKSTISKMSHDLPSVKVSMTANKEIRLSTFYPV